MEASAQRGHAHRRYAAILVLTAALVGCAPASPSPSSPVEPSATPAEAAEPIQQALYYLPVGATTFAFTDWVAIKDSMGVPDLTSAAPDDERDAFVRQLGTLQASDTPFTFIGQGVFVAKALLGTWGFDNLDLDWEASITSTLGVAYVLRLREGFDLAPVLGHFDERGFTTDVVEGVTVRSHELSSEDWIFRSDPAFLNAALMPDGRTLVLSGQPEPLQPILAQRGQLAGPDGPPVVLDAVAALEHPSGAWLSFALDRLCDPGARAGPEAQQLLADVGPLHPYTLVAVGYRPDLEPAGRIVFGYVDPAEASADLEGRRKLASEGVSLEFGLLIRDRLFSVVDATVEEGSLILRVGPPAVEEPQPGAPAPTVSRFLLQMTFRYDMMFAACDLSL